MKAQAQQTLVQPKLAGIGRIEEGFDGEVAWESNMLQGPRVKEGDELEGRIGEWPPLLLGFSATAAGFPSGS